LKGTALIMVSKFTHKGAYIALNGVHSAMLIKLVLSHWYTCKRLKMVKSLFNIDELGSKSHIRTSVIGQIFENYISILYLRRNSLYASDFRRQMTIGAVNKGAFCFIIVHTEDIP
jgi:hypothetical protein